MAEPNPHRGTFRLAGVPVDFPISGVLGVVLLAYLWAPAFAGSTPGTSRWVLAGAFAILLSLATLVHEFAHALTARALGYPVHRVVLQLMGGVTYYERRHASPLRESAIAASGPVATFAVAGLSAGVAALAPPGSIALVLAEALTWANLVMGIYNSLPGIPLDGGTVLRCLVWAASGSENTGIRVAARVGQVVAALTFATPFLLSWLWGTQADLLFFVLAGLLAAMLWTGATAQLRLVNVRVRAGGITAGSLARRAVPVDRDLPLAEALRRAAAAGASTLVVIGPDGVPMAIGQDAAIAAVPEQRRPWVQVGTVARSLDPGALLPMDTAGEDLVRAVAGGGRDEYLVVDPQGLVYGVLLAADLEAMLRRQPG